MIRIDPIIVQVKQNSFEIASPVNPTMHKGGLGKILSIAVAIAIPVAAPTIAASMGVSGAVAAMTGFAAESFAVGAISGAITGAALGAISAAVQGQSIKKGALTGGISGGIAGGVSSFATGPADGGLGGSEAGLQSSTVSPADAVFPRGVEPTGLTTADLGLPARLGPPSTQVAISQSVADGSMGASFMETMGQTGTALKGKFTNPEVLANMTLKAGGMVAGAIFVPDDAMPVLPPEFNETYTAYMEELKALKAKDEDAFNTKMALSKQYLVNAGQLDPIYGGNQAANNVLISGANRIKEDKRKRSLTDFRTDTTNEDRRADIGLAKDRAAAFDSGYLNTLKESIGLTDASMKALPSAKDFSTYASGLATGQDDIFNMYNAAGNINTANVTARENLSKTIGGFATGDGEMDKDKTTDTTVAAGLNTDNLYGNVQNDATYKLPEYGLGLGRLGGIKT